VICGHAAEGASRDFFFAVVKENWIVNYSKNIVRADSSTFNCDFTCAFKGSFLLSGDRLSDGNREKVSLSIAVRDRLHVHDLKEFELVHESVKWCSPSVANCLQVLDLVLVDVKDWHRVELILFLGTGIFPQRHGDLTLNI